MSALRCAQHDCAACGDPFFVPSSAMYLCHARSRIGQDGGPIKYACANTGANIHKERPGWPYLGEVPPRPRPSVRESHQEYSWNTHRFQETTICDDCDVIRFYVLTMYIPRLRTLRIIDHWHGYNCINAHSCSLVAS